MNADELLDMRDDRLELQRLQRLTKWVSVNDAMPEPGKDVLTCNLRDWLEDIRIFGDKPRKLPHCRILHYVDEIRGWYPGGISGITHWMHLPDKPSA